MVPLRQDEEHFLEIHILFLIYLMVLPKSPTSLSSKSKYSRVLTLCIYEHIVLTPSSDAPIFQSRKIFKCL